MYGFDWQIEEQRLKKLGAEFYRTNRGGLITFHGPGQLVAYPILNLHHFQQGMKKYIATLEQTLINTCACFSIEARTTQDTGVWVGDSKIAAIGRFAENIFFFFCVHSNIIGVHHFGWDFCVCDHFYFNPTMEVVTFCLQGWCMLDVFLLYWLNLSLCSRLKD